MPLDTFSDLPIDEECRRRFESAWRKGRPEALEPFLPPANDSRFAATLEALIEIDLEFAWKSGVRPARLVEHYLAMFPALNEPDIVQRLLRQEHFVRQRYGDRPRSEEYRRRFPNLDVAFNETRAGPVSPAPTAQCSPAGYEMVRTVGSGGMGVVFEVRQPSLDRVIALKMMRPRSGPGSTGDRVRFLAEARIAARLEHPSVVTVHEVFAADGAAPYYTMKLVRGRTLEEAIHEFHADGAPWGAKTLERQRLLNAFLTVSRTMAFAHSREVIHRDLKPANIVLGDYGETVILDWGLAKLLGDSASPTPTQPGYESLGSADATAQGSVMGTPAFMSPEQAGGRIDELDARSDIFSLGAVLYEILTGKLPFYDNNPLAVLHKVMHVDPPRPRSLDPSIPRPLEAICQRALAKQPADRYVSADQLASDLENLLAGEPVTAYRERLLERWSRWSKRHRTLVASGTVALVLCFLGSVAGLFLRQEYVNERQRQAAEFERKQNLQRIEHQQAIERAAGELEVLAAAEIRAGRFAAAEKLLYKAVSGLHGEAELEPLRTRLEDRRGRLRRLGEFYHLWNRSERLATMSSPVAFLKIDTDALAACVEALEQVGVPEGKPDWWLQMPDDDLSAEQRSRLRVNTADALRLAALWKTKRGLLQSGSTAQESFRSARVYLQQVQGYSIQTSGKPSPAAEVLDNFCRFRLGVPLPPAPPGPPVTAADAYFLGTLHLFVSHLSDSGLVRLVLLQMPRNVLARIGIDFNTPRATADSLLRAAATLEPAHYWAHFWLGHGLYYSGDINGAELSFNTCVSLRPEYMLGYTERCQIQIVQIDRLEKSKNQFLPRPVMRQEQLAGTCTSGLLGTPVLGQALCFCVMAEEAAQKLKFLEFDRAQGELKKRMLRGIVQAANRDPLDPTVEWILGQALDWVGRHEDAYDAYSAAAELEASRRLFDPNWEPSDIDIVRQMRRMLDIRLKNNPQDIGLNRANAATFLAQGNEERALSVAGTLGEASDQAVKGSVYFGRKEYAQAEKAFVASLAVAAPSAKMPAAKLDPDERIRFQHRPGFALASIGLARSLEALGASGEALQAFERLTHTDSPAIAEWQKLEGHAGRARLLVRLGRETEAREAVDDLRQLDTGLAQLLAAHLFPRPAK